MQIVLITVGKPLSGAYFQLTKEYEKRLSKDVTINWHYVTASASQNPEECRIHESMIIEGLCKPSDNVIVLDERGTEYTNQAFAEQFERYAGRQGRLLLVIGGAFGVTDALRQRAAMVWSLSPLVFPHQLVRVMVLEQLYRTVQLQKGHPYHHA